MKRRANKIDKIIGANLRTYRLMREMSQEALGNAIGKSAHQIQKYENATNRVAVSTLLDISKTLNLPMVLFWTERLRHEALHWNSVLVHARGSTAPCFCINGGPVCTHQIATSVWFDKMHDMRPSEALFWLKFWYREKSWQRGLQDEREAKPQKPPFWALKRFYLTGYAHRERELAYDQARWATRSEFYRPLEISASTEPSDYEWDAPEYWPPTPPPPLSAEQQAERDRIMRGSAALAVWPCWIFHKNDADPWPSRLHGHHNERPLKLDAITGFVYSIQTRRQVQSLRRRELERIQYALLASKDFADRARELIQSI